MGLPLIIWVMVSLLSISLMDKYPYWGLVVAAVGGTTIGAGIYKPLQQQVICQPLFSQFSSVFGRIQKFEIHLITLPLLVLLFSNWLSLKFSFFALGVILVFWSFRKLAIGRFLDQTPFDFPILLLLLTSCVGLCASVDLGISTVGVLKLFSGVIFFYGLVNSINSDLKLDNAIFLFLVSGVGIAFVALWIMQPAHSKFPFVAGVFEALPHFSSRWVHPNYLGGTLTVFFLLAFWNFVFRTKNFVFWLILAIIGFVLILTQSRSAILGVFIALVLTGILEIRLKRLRFFVISGTGVFLLYFIYDVVFFAPLGFGLFGNDFSGRPELWERAVYIAQDFPFTGIGMNTFPIVIDFMYPLFTTVSDIRVPHSHNLFLQVVVETGIPGFVAFWILLGALGRTAWVLLHLTGSGKEASSVRPYFLGLAGGIVAYLFYGITDVISLGEKAGIVFWAALGVTVVLWRRAQSGGEIGEATD